MRSQQPLLRPPRSRTTIASKAAWHLGLVAQAKTVSQQKTPNGVGHQRKECGTLVGITNFRNPNVGRSIGNRNEKTNSYVDFGTKSIASATHANTNPSAKSINIGSAVFMN